MSGNGEPALRSEEWPMKLKIVLEPSDEGGYTVYVPCRAGCISEDNTIDDAIANIREAIALYLEPVEGDLTGREGLELREPTV